MAENPPPRAPSSRPPLIFVLPDDRDSISGGNLYKRCLLEALERTPAESHALNFAQGCGRLARGWPGIYLVDSLLLEKVPTLVARAASGQPIFLVVHLLPSLAPGQGSPAAVRREQALLEGLTGFVATSDYTRRYLMLRWHHGRPIFVVPPALVVTPSGRKRPTDRFRGAVVGNVVAGKRVLEFLECLDRVLSAEDRFEIEIVGRLDAEPAYAAACRALVARRPLLRRGVRFTGAVPPSAMGAIYRRSTAFISASEMETYGMALHEARAHGVPILAVEAGNIGAHVSSAACGTLYPSVPALARGCIELMRDPDRLLRLNRGALLGRPTDTYSWRAAAASLLEQVERWREEANASGRRPWAGSRAAEASAGREADPWGAG